MFGRKKSSSWIQGVENRFWLINAMLLHFDFYSENQFARETPIILDPRFHRFGEDDNPESFLQELTEHLIAEARINVKGVKFEIYREEKVEDVLPDGMEYSTGWREGTSGIFHKIDTFGYAHISIEEHLLENYAALLGTLCHELAHVFLHIKRPPDDVIWDEEDEEFVTDMTTVMLGFGIYICNSQEQFLKSSDGRYTSWSASVRGYLSLEECCLIQGFLSAHFDQDFGAYRKYLETNPRKFIEEAREHFAALSPEEFEREYFSEESES